MLQQTNNVQYAKVTRTDLNRSR